MHTAVSAPVAIVARINFASRCLVALAFGGAIPIVALVTAGAVLEGVEAGGSPALHGMLVALAIMAFTIVIVAGHLGLRALEDGWAPFVRYLGALTVAAQLARLPAAVF